MELNPKLLKFVILKYKNYQNLNLICQSLFSMGFHYPCDSYLNYIIENSSDKSKVIYDKRKNIKDTGHEKLQMTFKKIKKLSKLKHDRISMIKEKNK